MKEEDLPKPRKGLINPLTAFTAKEYKMWQEGFDCCLKEVKALLKE